jgi:Predicted Fe-S oxidoreductases
MQNINWLKAVNNHIRFHWQILTIEKRLPTRISLLIKNRFGMKWKSNFHALEIEIITSCDLGCYNCDRSCRQAPSNERMQIKQITKFVDESIKHGWKWTRINILGGEPTLHPDLFEIMDELKIYKNYYPGCVITLFSNGYNKITEKILLKIPHFIQVRNTRKKTQIQKFAPYNMAPKDIDGFDMKSTKRSCYVTEICGLGFTRYGFYLCGAGASIDRVFGFDIGRKSLAELSKINLEKQRSILCQLCGHFHNIEVEKEKISETWFDTYERYKHKKPELSLY